VTDLSLPDDWVESAFRRDTFGPDGAAGLAATLEREAGDAALSVVPVRYDRTDGQDHVEALTEDFEHRSGGVDVHGPRETAPLTAFALRARFAPVGRDREVVYAVARDADDAFAVACLLARACSTPRDLRDRVDDHGGAGVGPTSAATLSDDEAVDAVLASETDRCTFTGRRTTSHALELPLRYAVATDGYPHTDADFLRVPTLVDEFAAVVSHDAWTERSLSTFDPTTSVDRRGPGEYALPGTDRVADANAEHLRLTRLGEDG
jgi:hypothetical protein